MAIVSETRFWFLHKHFLLHLTSQFSFRQHDMNETCSLVGYTFFPCKTVHKVSFFKYFGIVVKA